MFHPSSASDLLDCDPLKPSLHLYVCQQHTIQIIQLVEAPPPPPPRHSDISVLTSSSCPSTSDSEENGASYCSSIVTSSHDREPIPWTDDTYNTRMKRVHAWRDGCPSKSSPLTSADTMPLKRKTQTEDDAVSHTSKRSRSRSISRLTGHPCPACDALFPSLSSLRKHGHAPDIPDACRIAVAYNFE